MNYSWTSIGISPSGSNIIAYQISSKQIYYSINYGNTFALSSPSLLSVEKVNGISVADNNYSVVYTKNNIYISNNYGVSYGYGSFNIVNNNSFEEVSISSDGKYIAACLSGNGNKSGIHISSDNGYNWEHTLSNNQYFTSISISESGKYIVACYKNNGGGIYTSSNYGITGSWIFNRTIPMNINWTSIYIKEPFGFAIASDISGSTYTSTDYGNIWTNTLNMTTNPTGFKKVKVIISNYGYAIALTDLSINVTSNYGDNWNIYPYPDLTNTITDIGVSNHGLLVTCNSTKKIYSSSIYSVFNNPKEYNSNYDVSFVSKGLPYHQLSISNILNTQFTIGFQNPIVLPDKNYLLTITNNSNPTDICNISIPVVYTDQNYQYSIPITNRNQNTLYDISLQTIYSDSNVISTIYKTQFTKGGPDPNKIICNEYSITDVSMIISFENCPIPPDHYNIYLKGSLNTRIIRLDNFLNIITITTTVNSLLPDSTYQLIIESNYIDVSYSSIYPVSIDTKSAPNNIGYNLLNKKVIVSYNEPSLVRPNFVTITLQNITNQTLPFTSEPKSLSTSYTSSDLSVNAVYDLTLQSVYIYNLNTMIINSSVITFTNVGKPTIISSYRFDSNPMIQKYVIMTSIFLASIPSYLISITYPGVNGIVFKSDLPQYATKFNLNGITQLGTYKIQVSAVFDVSYASDIFELTIKPRPIIQFGIIDMSYTYISIPYTIQTSIIPPPQYKLYLINNIYPTIYDQSFNIPLNTNINKSFITKFNTYAGTGNYNIYISDGFFYSDYININLPEIKTVDISDSNISNNYFTVEYNVFKYIEDSSYSLFVDNTLSNISFSNTIDSKIGDITTVNTLSVTITVMGTMDYYIIHYKPDRSIYRTPTKQITIESKTKVTFEEIDISYNYFIVPTIIETLAYRPRFNLDVTGIIPIFNSVYNINPKTTISSTNTKILVYANTGKYNIKVTDGIDPEPDKETDISLNTSLTTLSGMDYSFTTATNELTKKNTNELKVYYYILNTYLPRYTLYLQNQDKADISFSTYSDISYIPSLFIASNRFTINLKDTITRGGKYSLWVSHTYSGANSNNDITQFTYTSPTIRNVSIDISNIVTLSILSTLSRTTINIEYTINSFDIIPLTYTLYLQDISFTSDLSYSYVIPNNPFQQNLNNYNVSNIITNRFDFSNIYVNTGDYRYFVVDSCGNRYGITNKYTLPNQTETIQLINDLSVNYFSTFHPNNNGSISTLYNILYESYKPTYTLVAINTTIPTSVTDCSYHSIGVYMDNTSTTITRATNPYSITVSNIYRTGKYSVYLRNNYNGLGGGVETTLSKDIYLYLPNDVSYNLNLITYDISSITIPFTITSYDISDVSYNIHIQNTVYDISYTKSFTIYNKNSLYSVSNILSNTISFQDLYVNTGGYTYKIYNNNGITYPGITTIVLPTTNTIRYKEIEVSTDTTKYDVNAKYDISYISYNSIHKFRLINDTYTDCSYEIINPYTKIETKYNQLTNNQSINNTLIIQDIRRKGTYIGYLQNIYNNYNDTELIKIPDSVKTTLLKNTISYTTTTTTVSSDCSSITIPFTITSYDVSLVQYTLFLENVNYKSDISANQSYVVLNNNRNYTVATTDISSLTFKNLYANSGKYKYHMKDNENDYNNNFDITIQDATTITLRDLSSTWFNTFSNTNIGSITARYDISYISYKPTYHLYAIHRITNDCSYTISTSKIPDKYIDIQNSYFISVSNMYRTGMYRVYLQNIYSGSTYIDKTTFIDISVNLPNDITYQKITKDVSSITISLTNTSYDISNIYTVHIVNSSVTNDISYNKKFLIPKDDDYTKAMITTKNIGFTDLFANTGRYYYYVTDLCGNRYPSNDSININDVSLSLLDSDTTIHLKDVSSTWFNIYSSNNSGSITARYDISFITYKPTYTLQVVNTNNGLRDCSYSILMKDTNNIPTNYSSIKPLYSLTIPNIYRTGKYDVYLTNVYNNNLKTEQLYTDISVNLPNNVNYYDVSSTITSIAIKFTITSFDINSTDYTLFIKNTSLDLSANKKFTLSPSTYYDQANTLNILDFSFQNLFANSGKYYYYFTNSNGINYPSINDETKNSIKLMSAGSTINIVDLSSTMYSTYIDTNKGGITARYQITVKSNSPTYTLIATNANYIYASTSITGDNIPSNINTDEYLSISSISRTGKYNVKLQNIYVGGTEPEYSNSIDISVNLPNKVDSSVTYDISSITIKYTITSFDIGDVSYTTYITNPNFGNYSANQVYTLPDNNIINSSNTSSLQSFTFPNLYVNNTLNNPYNYYVVNSKGVTYPGSSNISLPTVETITLIDVSQNPGSITAKYDVSYITYTPSYEMVVTNTTIGTTDCSYSVMVTGPGLSDYSVIKNKDYYLSIPNNTIKRSGKYNVILNNYYNNNRTKETTITKDILMNIPNVVSFQTVTSDISSITIPFSITSYDISNVEYSVRIQHSSYGSFVYDQSFILANNINYNETTNITRSFTYANLFVNAGGNYTYNITNKNGVTYPGSNITLSTVTNTITLIDVSQNPGSITAKYDVSYITYTPSYEMIVTNTTIGTTDCSYSAIIIGPSDYSTIRNGTKFYLSIPNNTIKRSGKYEVVLNNYYNNNNTRTKETTITKDILMNIPNTVSFQTVTADISSITIPFSITSYDISNVEYTVRIRDVYYTSLVYDQSFILANNTTDYNIVNSTSRSFTFANLFVNTSFYTYSITNKNGVTYNGIGTSDISLVPVTKTITLKDVSSTWFNTYSPDNNGSITAKYDISYISYAPKYKITVVNTFNGLNDCSYSNEISTNLPTTYNEIKNISYYLSVSNIKRTGKYNVYLQNISGSFEQTSIMDISVNLPNNVSVQTQTITSDISSITIPLSIISYDISNVYTVKIQNAYSLYSNDISYNSSFTLLGSNNYTSPTSSTTNITFNYYANMGQHILTISDITGKIYLPTTTFSVPSPIFTASLRDLDISVNRLPITLTKYGKITTIYDISYITYKPTYTIYATNQYTGMLDCSYSSRIPDSNIPKTYRSITNPYTIDISNIYRSGMYRVFLQNIDGSGNIDNTATKDISINIPTDVSFIRVASDNSYSIDISFQITSYDISFMNYKLFVKHKERDISLNIDYALYPTRIYNQPTTTTIQSNRFQYLTISGNYNYFVVDSCNNIYDGSSIYVDCDKGKEV
jgi:hypothetical protein